jgi:hypothetical protein
MTTRTRKPRSRPARSCKLYDGSPALLVITEGTKVDDYFVTPIPADFGRAFEVRKCPAPGADPAALPRYYVNLGGDDGHDSCECPGHVYHGHRTVCRHVACLKALAAAGKLVA